jgi:hypothetical protein
MDVSLEVLEDGRIWNALCLKLCKTETLTGRAWKVSDSWAKGNIQKEFF